MDAFPEKKKKKNSYYEHIRFNKYLFEKSIFF